MPPGDDSLPVKVARIETKLDVVLADYGRRLDILDARAGSSSGRILSTLASLAAVAALIVSLGVIISGQG